MSKEMKSVKVYTTWVENEKPEIRRFEFTTAGDAYGNFTTRLLQFYPGLINTNYILSWKDEDGDFVRISSEVEFKNALTAVISNFGISMGQTLKFYVNFAKSDEERNLAYLQATPPDCNLTEHFGVTCDNCDNAVFGFRYKCVVCSDFDLCSKCERARAHPEHCIVRIPFPTMPRDVVRVAVKRSCYFLRSIASNSSGDGYPCKRNKRESSSERRHGEGHHRQGEHHRQGDSNHRRERDHHRRSRPSWLETFATYMNEFANLAGDIDFDISSKPATSGTQQAANTNDGVNNTTKMKEANSQTNEPKHPEPTSTSEPAQPNLPMQTQLTQENIMSGNAQANVSNGTQAQDVIMVPESSDDSSSVNSKRDGSPEKGDDWTMINNDKDIMDAYINESLPEPTPPIGFNLPEEFRTRVNITGGQTLYPPLNAATAVLNPKENDDMGQQAASSAPLLTPPQTPAAPQPGNTGATPTPSATLPGNNPGSTNTQPRKPHPLPHIEAALLKMLGMGFNDEGGWLSQLLENTRGDIAAVLELLTPVRQ